MELIQNSHELDKLVSRKADAGCFSKIRKLAFFEKQGRYGTVIGVLESLHESGLLVSGAEITRVTVERGSIQFTFLFAGSVASVTTMIEAIPVPKRGRTAPSVLTKMAYARIAKLQKAIDNHNSFVEQYKQNSSGLKAAPRLERSDLDADRIETMKSDAYYGGSHAFDDMMKFIARPDVTKDVLQSGWNLFEVQRIQEA